MNFLFWPLYGKALRGRLYVSKPFFLSMCLYAIWPNLVNVKFYFHDFWRLISVFTIIFLDEELPQREEITTSDTFSMLPSEKLTGVVLVFQQFVALYVKRFCNSKRNLKGFFCEVVLSKIVLIFVSKIFWRLFFLLLSQWIFRLFCLRCSS